MNLKVSLSLSVKEKSNEFGYSSKIYQYVKGDKCDDSHDIKFKAYKNCIMIMEIMHL